MSHPQDRVTRTLRVAVGLLLLGMEAPAALALCMDGRAPAATQEAEHATAVVQALVTQARDLHEDAADPHGTTATRYTVRVLRPLRGHLPARFTLHSENTSARFAMEPGERYLLFVSRDGSGRYFIDACGNSAPLAESQAALKALSARRGKGPP